MSISQDKKEKAAVKDAHETAEKIAEPIAPLAMGAQVKFAAKTHAKVTGRKNWLIKHHVDLTIFLGLVWCILRVIQFYFSDRAWTVWIKLIDVFLPAIFMFLSLIYRMYPFINLFSFHKKR